MKNLHNLPFKKKFAIVIVPLVLILICFDYLQIRQNYLNYYDSKRLNKAINIGIEINHVVHELQKERAITAGFLSNEGEGFSSQLMRQRHHTDSVLSLFFGKVSQSQFRDITAIHTEDLNDLKAQLDKVDDLRTQIDNHDLHIDQAAKYYAEINKAALNTVSALINETPDKEAAQQVHAIIYFLESKEFTSVERAIGTQIFSNPHPDQAIITEFSNLIATQDAYLDAFLTICNRESFDFYYRTVQGEDISEAERMRTLIALGTNLSEDPGNWYKVITAKINALKRVEEFMLDHMHQYTESIASEAKWNFWTFLIIDLLIGIISLTLMTLIVSKLIKNVATLERFTQQVSRGDLSQRVHIDTKDEIGQYAKTFNVMVNELNKSHKALKKEKAQAEYLYENIYKQSEVVFENVEQGIFLLDKELKISNLYSKAVERIFDNKIIANENFSNFMRPRLIQRDFEALEMFMKHLFNSDIDEDVVNQLNPIEQVKIFIGTNGVVITKYLRVSFTRIEREGVIQNIMVTISDETESVLLQQHMEESEAKKKQETEYMLSILKLDPVVLKDYLESSRQTLKGISVKYEESGKSDLNQLLRFTFEVIHSVKGNAVSIGLDLIADRLHEIEDSITVLMDKNVTGDKFLSILYDIEVVDGTLCDMSKLLDKVADIYRNYPSQGNKMPKVSLEKQLTQGLSTMSEEVGKQVNFQFNNPDNVALPECVLNPVKDVLVQLMRNSLSHGIEAPDLRQKLGKATTGKVSVSLNLTTENEVAVCYKDDGSGLDIEKIRERAISNNIITEEQAQELNPNEITSLIFYNGFSTKEGVDKFSGRGQGLSLVRSLIEEQNGSFNLKFQKDEFFQITFKIPLALQNKMEQAA